MREKSRGWKGGVGGHSFTNRIGLIGNEYGVESPFYLWNG